MILALAVVFTVVCLAIVVTGQNQNRNQRDSYIDYQDSTPDQKEAGEQIKKESKESSPEKYKAEVFLIDANQYGNEVEVRANVNNLQEPDHVCRFIFKGGDQFEKETTTIVSQNTTVCGALIIPTAEFSKSGKWTVKVLYESSNYKGEVSSDEFEIVK